jgi:hypothetical protein
LSWIDEYANTATQFVDAPTMFQRVAAYWALGAAIGKRAYFQFGMIPVFPNLYTVLVGKSGFVKKSVTKNFALDTLGQAIPDLDLPGRGSPESFRDSLEERDWYGVLHYDEFFEYLVKGRKDYNADLDVTVMELFAHGRKTPIRTKTSGEIKIPSNAIISFVAPTTLDLLLRGIKKDDLMSGKLARFMFVTADQDIEYPVPPPMPHTTIPYLGKRLKSMLPPTATSANPLLMTEAPEARQALIDYYHAIRERVGNAASPLFGGSFSRAQVYTIKLAMINAVANGRTIILPDDYAAIQDLVSNWATCLDEIIKKIDVEDRFHEQILKAEEYLRVRPVARLGDLQRYMRLRKYEMSDLLEHLKMAGIVEVELNTDVANSKVRYKDPLKAAAPEGSPEDEALAREIEMAENIGPDPSVGGATQVAKPVK